MYPARLSDSKAARGKAPKLERETRAMSLEAMIRMGITLEDAGKGETILRLINEYESGVAAIRDAKNEAAKTTEDKIDPAIQAIKDDTERQARAIDFKTALFTLLSEYLEEDENLPFVLGDVVTDLRVFVNSEQDYITKRKLGIVSKRPVIKFDRSELEDLQSVIKMIWSSLVRSMPTDAMVTKNDLKRDKLDTVPEGKVLVYKSKTDGSINLDLSKLPQETNEDEESANMGRNAKLNALHFKFNGEYLPTDLLISDVCHDYLSDRSKGILVTPKDMREAINAAGYKSLMPKGEDKAWKIELATGVLEGWEPTSK